MRWPVSKTTRLLAFPVDPNLARLPPRLYMGRTARTTIILTSPVAKYFPEGKEADALPRVHRASANITTHLPGVSPDGEFIPPAAIRSSSGVGTSSNAGFQS